jgi:hypothetical protein
MSKPFRLELGVAGVGGDTDEGDAAASVLMLTLAVGATPEVERGNDRRPD